MYKILLAHVGNYKRPSILAFLAMTIEVLFELSIPFLMAAIIDQGINRSDRSWENDYYQSHQSFLRDSVRHDYLRRN
ncbi:TPA: hypothetical protein ACHWCH_001533 [Streptococcus suis]